MTGLRSRTEMLALAESILDRNRHGDAEVVVTETSTALTRFASNVIHQNVAATSLSARVRIVADGRVGVGVRRGDAGTDLAGALASADQARELSPASDVTPLPKPDGGSDELVAFSQATADATPDVRADAVGAVAAAAVGRDVEAFGGFNTDTAQIAIASTTGMRRHYRSSNAGLVCVVRGADGAAYGARFSHDVTAIDARALAADVVDTCLRNQGAKPIDPGTYEVVLSPYAVTEMMDYLGYLGFSALAVQEERSFMKPGVKLMSDAVRIHDDATDPTIHPLPFDAEGATTRPVTFIDQGVCRDVVHDSATARRAGVVSTGHALPMPNTFGPWPRHMAMAPGTATIDELVRAVERGIFVTRFWYVRAVHPLRTIITGMTREGTFLIEKGRIVRPVRDLRFTQSIVDALADVRGVSADRLLHLPEGESAVLAPALHLGRFAFTS